MVEVSLLEEDQGEGGSVVEVGEDSLPADVEDFPPEVEEVVAVEVVELQEEVAVAVEVWEAERRL